MGTRIRTAEDEALLFNEVLPRGIRFQAIREIRRDLPTLGDAICAARYRTINGNGLDPAPYVEKFQERSPVSVRREKNGKVHTFDLDKELLELELADDKSARGSHQRRVGSTAGGAARDLRRALRAYGVDARGSARGVQGPND